MCPFGNMNEAKYMKAYESGKIGKNGETQDFELVSGLV